MSGRRSREGTRTERALVRLLQAQGIAAPKTGGMYSPRTDIGRSFIGSDTTIEVKRRPTGFARLYDRLNDRDVLIGKADWQEPLAVLRMSLAAEIAKRMV